MNEQVLHDRISEVYNIQEIYKFLSDVPLEDIKDYSFRQKLSLYCTGLYCMKYGIADDSTEAIQVLHTIYDSVLGDTAIVYLAPIIDKFNKRYDVESTLTKNNHIRVLEEQLFSMGVNRGTPYNPEPNITDIRGMVRKDVH